MQHGGPSGLHNAPVTKVVLCISAFLTIVAGIRGRRLGLSIEEFKNLHLWRVVPSVLAFSSTPELLFGLYLIYYFRMFERQIGSNKYSVFVIFSLTVSTCFQILALTFFNDTIQFRLASGPYGLIFASFVPYFFDIPITSRFNVLGMSLSDKSGVYLAGLQLLFSLWKRSLIPGICGVLAGILYRTNLFGIRRLKFPGRIASFFSQLFSSSPPNSYRRPHVRGPYAGHQVQRNVPSMARAPLPEPPESSVATLVSMGFDRVAARQALMQARNDINVATNILLEAQSR